MSVFLGAHLRTIRLFHELSLADLGERVGVSKQFLSRVENGAEPVSPQLERMLCDDLQVLPEFFQTPDPSPIADEQCHFRKQLTTKLVLRQAARARGELLKRLVCVLDEHLELPSYKVNEADPGTAESIERAAEKFRMQFSLGFGPLSNVTRVAENAGAVVMKVHGLAPEIDAISFATKRPLIALNADGKSSCRTRFGIAHEIGHLALHIGIMTGDRLTEAQANRFASSVLMPRATFGSECRIGLRAARLNWPGLSELKLRWGVSKAAVIYRAKQLGVFDEDQARSGYIGLKRKGEAIQEVEDHLVPSEEPEVVAEGLRAMKAYFGIPESAVARQMCVQPRLLDALTKQSVSVSASNVVDLTSRFRRQA